MRASDTFLWAAPPGSSTATFTLQTTAGGSLVQRTFVITSERPLLDAGASIIGQEHDLREALASFSGQVGDRRGDFVTLSVDGAPCR